MNIADTLPIALGLLIFSFLITSVLIVPYINLLYKMKLTRRKEAPKKGKVPLFDKLHDIKAGTPVGGGVLIISVVSLIFYLLFPFASHMGVCIRSSFSFKTEMFVILFTCISFGILGLSDDIIKTFGKPRKGSLGMWLGLSRKVKFAIQWLLAIYISFVLVENFGINIFQRLRTHLSLSRFNYFRYRKEWNVFFSFSLNLLL